MCLLHPSMNVLSGLCGIRSRKRSPRHPPPGAAHSTATTVEATNQQPSSPAEASPATTADEPISMSPLPPPPAVTAMHLEASMEKGAREWTERQRRLKSSSVNWNAAKQTLLLVSPSTRMLPRSLSVRQWVEDQHQKKKLGKHRTEDSIWTKTIILGERCQVPDEDDDICDKKGNRISAYHPRNPQSVPVSRSTSFIDPATIT